MSFWSGLAWVGGGGGVPADWQRSFGEHFKFASAYRVPTGQLADAVACSRSPACGCRHEIVTAGDELIAACRCDSEWFGRCEPFTLQREDAGLFEIEAAKLCRDIARVLGLDGWRYQAAVGSCIAPRCFEAGGYEPLVASAILYLPSSAGNQAADIHELIRVRPEPFLLLIPIRGPWHRELEAVLRLRDGAFLALEECLVPGASGGFEAVCDLQPMLREWEARACPAGKSREALRILRREIAGLAARAEGAEPCTDATAAQALALIQQLETQTRWRKASVLQVFRLYCLEALSASQVARRCGCSKTLVVRRLRFLRQKLGRDPVELRSVSSHVEAMEDSLSDSRARRIRRHAAIEEDGEEEG